MRGARIGGKMAVWLGLAIAIGGAGCQGEGAASKAPQTNATSSNSASPAEAPAVASPLSRDAAPAAVVRTFLDSLQAGDQKLTSALLTERALDETSKNNFSINSMAATGLECQVRQTEHPDRQTAHVSSFWKEGEGAEAEEYEVVWVLRSTAEGWRISGMATAIFPGEPPVWFNFENGEEFRRQMEQTDAEVARREEAAARQASLPERSRENGVPSR